MAQKTSAIILHYESCVLFFTGQHPAVDTQYGGLRKRWEGAVEGIPRRIMRAGRVGGGGHRGAGGWKAAMLEKVDTGRRWRREGGSGTLAVAQGGARSVPS